MSKIPAREFLRDDNSARTTLDTILASPYTTLYEKPLRIMTINPNGEETVEVTRTTYKAINDTVSVDKITEICENIVMDKILGKEKSLMSQLLFSLGEQVIEVEKNLSSKIDTNIDIKVKNKHFDNLEKDLSLKLENILSEKLRIISTRINENLENDISDFETKFNEQQNLSHKKLELYLNQKVEEEVNRQLSIIHGNIEKMFRDDISKRLDKIHNNITKIIQEELNKRIDIQSEYENCQDGICLLPVQHPEDENINETKNLENDKDQFSLQTSVADDVASHGDITLLPQPDDSFKYIDENLLPDGSDMIFDDIHSEAKEEDINISEPKEEDINISEPKEEDIIISELKEDINISEPKEEDINIPEPKEEDIIIPEQKEEDIIISEPKEDIIISEPKEDIIISEPKEDINISEPKEDINISEPKEDINIPESKEDIIIPEPKEDIIISEQKEDINIPESKEDIIIPETKEDIIISETKEDINISETKEEDINIPESKEDIIIPETKEDIIISETKEDIIISESKEDINILESKEDINILESKEDINILESNLKVIIGPETNEEVIENINSDIQIDVSKKSKSVSNIPKLPLSHRKKKKIGGK